MALWFADIVLLLNGYSWSAGVLFLALLFVVPWLLVVYVSKASKHTTAATNSISTASYRRYEAWL